MLAVPPKASPKAVAARQTTRALRELLIGYRSLLEDDLREQGLTLPQLRLLHAVAEQAELSSAAIARRCQITPQTLQAMLERAVREGWIVRQTSQRNHRILTATLTAKGRRLLARGEALAAEIESRVWHGISLATLEEANTTLSRGIANLNTELAGRAKS